MLLRFSRPDCDRAIAKAGSRPAEPPKGSLDAADVRGRMLALVEEGFRRSSLPLVRGKGHQVSSPSPKRASGGQGADAVACHSCAV